MLNPTKSPPKTFTILQLISPLSVGVFAEAASTGVVHVLDVKLPSKLAGTVTMLTRIRDVMSRSGR